MLSTEQLYTLLAHGFFPKWLSTLRQWLGQARAPNCPLCKKHISARRLQ